MNEFNEQPKKRFMSVNEMLGLDDDFGKKKDENSKVPLLLDINKLVPFNNHPFKLYEGQRLDAIITSVKELGVLLPIIVRKMDGDEYEILSGHNRVNAAKIAGLTQVPAVIKENITKDEAMLIVTETNLNQRSFSDLSLKEKVVVLKNHYDAIKGQGKRNDLILEIEYLCKASDCKEIETSGQIDQKLETREIMADKFDLSSKTIARFIKLSELDISLLNRADSDDIPFMAAYDLAFISKEKQQKIEELLNENNFKIDLVKAKALRDAYESNKLTDILIYQILSGEKKPKAQKDILATFKLKPKVFSKYFAQPKSHKEIEEVIEKALELYFRENEEDTE